jgi:hypothetical protein
VLTFRNLGVLLTQPTWFWVWFGTLVTRAGEQEGIKQWPEEYSDYAFFFIPECVGTWGQANVWAAVTSSGESGRQVERRLVFLLFLFLSFFSFLSPLFFILYFKNEGSLEIYPLILDGW